jgi:DNA topoisomerase II
LILTEGDSAKALAISGLSVIGRDKYGVFPLKGKLLNVRDATTQAMMKNAEIDAITKIIGLKHGVTYTSDNLKDLRYGCIMIMADQDQDGR